MNNMADMLDAVVGFFKEDEWPYTEIEGQPFFTTGFKGDNGQFNCFAQLREDEGQFLFYSVAPVNVPEDKRLWVGEFLTRANYGLYIGNFEMDFGDGELRFKTSIDVEGDRLTAALVGNMVYTNVLMMDRYLPGIMRVIYGNASPSEAINEIEA
jgi:hypothetical protein